MAWSPSRHAASAPMVGLVAAWPPSRQKATKPSHGHCDGPILARRVSPGRGTLPPRATDHRLVTSTCRASESRLRLRSVPRRPRQRNKGTNPPDKGMHPPNEGMNPPDKGMNPPDKGMNPPDKGMNPPDKGMNPPNTACTGRESPGSWFGPTQPDWLSHSTAGPTRLGRTGWHHPPPQTPATPCCANTCIRTMATTTAAGCERCGRMGARKRAGKHLKASSSAPRRRIFSDQKPQQNGPKRTLGAFSQKKPLPREAPPGRTFNVLCDGYSAAQQTTGTKTRLLR